MLSYTPEQAVGQDVSMLLRPERLEAMQAFLAQVRDGIGVRDIESSIVRRDGSLVDVRLSVAPLANGNTRQPDLVPPRARNERQ